MFRHFARANVFTTDCRWGAGTTLSAIYLPALATGYLVFEAAESYFTSSPASALPKGKAACTTC